MYSPKGKGVCFFFTRREQEGKNISNNHISVSQLRDSVEKGEAFLMAVEDAPEVVAVIAELPRFQ